MPFPDPGGPRNTMRSPPFLVEASLFEGVRGDGSDIGWRRADCLLAVTRINAQIPLVTPVISHQVGGLYEFIV